MQIRKNILRILSRRASLCPLDLSCTSLSRYSTEDFQLLWKYFFTEALNLWENHLPFPLTNDHVLFTI